MPLGRPFRSLIVALFAWAVAACASAPEAPVEAAPATPVEAAPAMLTSSELISSTARMPRDIQFGVVGMAIQRVEQNVSRTEVAAAVASMIVSAPVCLRWPSLWIEEPRRNSFVVRYDLMARDWGEPAAASSQARMQEFVEIGFLREQTGSNRQIVTYTITETGLSYLDGAVEPGRRMSFCGPAERRLVAINEFEWGQFPCGTLRVHFTHDGEAWPSWARTEAARARLAAASWPAANTVVGGSVSLSRQWFRRQDVPPGVQNGALRSICYDARRQQIIGDDLSLSLPVD